MLSERATPVMLDSTWRKIEYRLDVGRWASGREGGRAARPRPKLLISLLRARIYRLNGGNSIQFMIRT